MAVDYNKLQQRIFMLLEEARIQHSCLDCVHFDEPSEACRMFGGQRPPARVIVTGCQQHEFKPPF